MSVLGIVVTVTFGLVVLQALVLTLGSMAGEDDDALSLTGVLAVPVGLLVIACFILACAQSCGDEPGEPVAAEHTVR